jgi:hypothetical protein
MRFVVCYNLNSNATETGLIYIAGIILIKGKGLGEGEAVPVSLYNAMKTFGGAEI